MARHTHPAKVAMDKRYARRSPRVEESPQDRRTLDRVASDLVEAGICSPLILDRSFAAPPRPGGEQR